MTGEGVVVLGIPIPSSSPVFLSIVAVHVVAGLVCTIAGIGAMLTSKRAGRHPSRLWRGWLRLHIAGMAVSYILLLTAFYVDNGPHLPLWRSLPPRWPSTDGLGTETSSARFAHPCA